MQWPDVIRSVRRHWLLVAVLTLLGLGAGVAVDRSTETVYRSEARFMVVPGSELREGVEVVDAVDVLSRGAIVATFTELLTSDRFADAAADGAGLDAGDYAVSSAIVQGSNVTELFVEGPSGEGAQRLATGIAGRAAEDFQRLARVYRAELIDAPNRPSAPTGVGVGALLAVGGLVGLALGIGLALLHDAARLALRGGLVPAPAAVVRPEADDPVARTAAAADG